MCLRYPGWLVIVIIRTLGDNLHHPDTHDMTQLMMSANHKPSWSALSQWEASLSPSENQSSPDSPGAVLCNEVGTTRYMGHGTLLYDRSLGFVSFYGFPKPIKNTQHTITALCGESFLFCQWVSWCDLKISLGHYLNNLVPSLNQGCKLVLFQSCNSICRLLFFCRSNLKKAENVKSDLWLFIFVTAGGTLGLSQIFTTKIKSEPPDIILSIGLVIWSQAWISTKDQNK